MDVQLAEDILEVMAEGAMPEVVAQTRNEYAKLIDFRNLRWKVRRSGKVAAFQHPLRFLDSAILGLESGEKYLRLVCHSDGMLQPCMIGAAENVVTHPKLFQTMQPLHLRCIKDPNTKRGKFDLAMD